MTFPIRLTPVFVTFPICFSTNFDTFPTFHAAKVQQIFGSNRALAAKNTQGFNNKNRIYLYFVRNKNIFGIFAAMG